MEPSSGFHPVTWERVKIIVFFIMYYYFHLIFHFDKGHEWNALERLRQESREKEVERKVEAFRKEHIKKEKMEHV